jgi:putative phosphoribosyl transferase
MKARRRRQVRESNALFCDRQDAGRQLATLVLGLKSSQPVVLALPRGGVAVAYEVAVALGAPLDIVLVMKIGAPQQEELAIGAVAEGENPETLINEALIRAFDIAPRYMECARSSALRELKRRREIYTGGPQPIDVSGRIAIIVDDGIATGATMLAALRVTRRRGPAWLVVASPVGSKKAIERLRKEAEEIVCPNEPADFVSVGQFYRRFTQLGDDEVIDLLTMARRASPKSVGPSS